MNSTLLFFTLITVVNVATYTAKTLITVHGNKLSAALINAVNASVYLLLVIYSVTDIPLLTKIMITTICNFIGVYIIKLIEEKLRKDKLWKVEATIKPEYMDSLLEQLNYYNLPYNYIDVTKYVIVNIYCSTQQDSIQAKSLLANYNAKYFVSESETL